MGTRGKIRLTQGDPLILFPPTWPSLPTEIFLWVMATARIICCDFLRTANFWEKSGGRDTVTANSRRHTASSWIAAVGMQSWWLRIVGTGGCKLFRWTAHIFAPLKTIRGFVCLVTFIRKGSGWSVRTWTARFAFWTANIRSSRNWETAA